MVPHGAIPRAIREGQGEDPEVTQVPPPSFSWWCWTLQSPLKTVAAWIIMLEAGHKPTQMLFVHPHCSLGSLFIICLFTCVQFKTNKSCICPLNGAQPCPLSIWKSFLV